MNLRISQMLLEWISIQLNLSLRIAKKVKCLPATAWTKNKNRIHSRSESMWVHVSEHVLKCRSMPIKKDETYTTAVIRTLSFPIHYAAFTISIQSSHSTDKKQKKKIRNVQLNRIKYDNCLKCDSSVFTHCVTWNERKNKQTKRDREGA